MKNFLSKNWKKILIILTIVFIAFNIIHKVVAPHILVEEYAKYGADVAPANIDINASNIINEVKENAPAGIPNDIFRLLIILVVGILAAVILSDLATKKPAPKKK